MSGADPISTRIDSRLRRSVDVVVALVVGLLALPIMAIAAIVVLASLGRPILFRQERSGLHGKPFMVLKFRTMRPARPGRDDDAQRTTRITNFLRASSIDELPQLWNILRGDMSIIGPRPTLPEQVARYGQHERGRLAVRPGITGWAQVNGRNAISWEARIELDLWYVANRSLALDMRILWLTALRLLRPEGIVGEGGVNPDFVGSSGMRPADPDDVAPARRVDPVALVGQSGRRAANIALIATGWPGVGALRLIEETGHRLVGVLTEPEGDAAGCTGSAAALADGTPVWPASLATDDAVGDLLRSEDVDILLNVHSPRIVAAGILAAPRIGSFNLHPGPLPEYAGPAAPSWALYQGLREHGVTLHWMSSTVNAGAVAFEARFPLSANDTGATAYARCMREGLPLVRTLLEHIADGRPVPAVAQDLSRRRYYRRKPPHDGWIPWSGPARQVVDLVRACDYTPWPSPWGLARTAAVTRRGFEIEIEIVRAAPTGEHTGNEPPGSIGRVSDDGVLVAASDEWVLVRQVRLGGRTAHPAETFRRAECLVPGPPLSVGYRSHSC